MHFFTIGHSNRSLGEFLSLLKKFNIEALIDIRSWPSSKKYPHFNREALEESLKAEGIRYFWLGRELGGYRKNGLGDRSPNKAWDSVGFRNYADYTLSEEFRMGDTSTSQIRGEMENSLHVRGEILLEMPPKNTLRLSSS